MLSELSQRERPLRLLILDNAEVRMALERWVPRPSRQILGLFPAGGELDEDSVTEWIPKTGNCHLITSRFTAWSHGVEVCAV